MVVAAWAAGVAAFATPHMLLSGDSVASAALPWRLVLLELFRRKRLRSLSRCGSLHGERRHVVSELRDSLVVASVLIDLGILLDYFSCGTQSIPLRLL